MKQHLLLFFLLVVGYAHGQQSFSNDRSQALFMVSQGDLLMRNGEPEKAIFKYTDAIVSDPNCSEAFMKRASANAKILRWEQAQKDYSTAVSLNPSSVIFYEARHKLYVLHHEYQNAIEDISLVVKLNPYEIHLKQEYLSALILNGDINRAEQYCDSLIHADSSDVMLWLYRSYICFVREDYASALNYTSKALLLDPLSSIGYDFLGNLYNREGKYLDAERAYTKAIALNPVFSIAYFNRSMVLQKQGRLAEAKVDLDSALAVDRSYASAYFNRAILHKMTNDYKAAESDLTKAIAIKPDFADAFLNRGFVNKFLGDYATAIEDIKKAVLLNPGDRNVLLNLGNMYLLFGDYLEAIEVYSQLIANHKEFAPAYLNRGFAHILFNNRIQGCDDFRKAKENGISKAEEYIVSFCEKF